MKLGECTANVTNVNIDAYMTSMQADQAFTTLNLNKVKFYNAWQGHLCLWVDNAYQSAMDSKNGDVAPVAGAYGNRVNITDSLLAKCGGPVILTQQVRHHQKMNQTLGVDVNVDDKSILYSYVTGQEAWFVAVGQTQLAAQVTALSKMIEDTAAQAKITAGYTSNQFIENVDTINLIMVNMSRDTPADNVINATYNKTSGGSTTTALNMGINDNGKQRNALLDKYQAGTKLLAGQVAPVFQSSTGGIAATDGTSGCFGIDFDAKKPIAPDASFFGGEYVTLYYGGMGVMLEYYNPYHPAVKPVH